MGELIDKFRNVRFPNWMRASKSDYPLPPISAANDNEKKLYESEAKDISSLYLSAPCNLTVINLRKPPKNFLRKHSKIVKLKLSASVKRRLRQDKMSYQKVREWLDEAEKIVNQNLFGADADER